ncbi:MAG: hypothetical protein K9G64_04480 [Bacteroidia bacterium]|nr:hypothetical protein [Bacteroidia bacterium]
MSQPIFDPIGAKSWSLGGCSTAESNVFSCSNNMAASAEIKSFQLGIYNQTRFGIKQLNAINTSLIFPNKWIQIGASISHYGYEKFNQQNMSLGIAKKLNSNFSLGITINYIAVNIAEQENTGAFAGSLSAYYKANKKLHLGLLIFNPTQSKYNINSYGSVPTFGRIGLKYLVNKYVYLTADAAKTLAQNLVISSGINYTLHPNFELSLGYANNPNYITFGFSTKLKQFDILFASSFHQTLGLTPHIGMVFYGK